MPSQPKTDLAKLRPRSLAGLMIHSQFLLVRFGMPGMPIVKPFGFGIPGMPGTN